jgi:hypothetical protein
MGTVEGVITRISEVAASITLEAPFEGTHDVQAQFRRPGDRVDVAVPGQVIGVSKDGGIWRGRPSVVLQFLTPLTQAPITQPEEFDEPTPEPEPDDVSDPPDDAVTELDQEPMLEDDPFWEARLDASARSSIPSLTDEDSAGADLPGLEPIPTDPPVLTGPPIVAAHDLPEPETYGLTGTSQDDDSFDESTIDRLKRADQRIVSSLPVTFVAVGCEYHGLACNFSAGGLYMAAENFPRVGSVVHVIFPLRDAGGTEQEVEFNAVVRWYRKDRPDLSLPDGFGLQIISFESPEDRWLYTSFTDKIMDQPKL